MATIDSLDIQIAGSAQKANQAVDSLIKNLNRLANSLKIDTSGLEKIGKNFDLSGISKQAKTVSENVKDIGAKMVESIKPAEGQVKRISKNIEQIVKETNEKTMNLTPQLNMDNLSAETKKYENQLRNMQNQLNKVLSMPSAEKQERTIERLVTNINEAKNALAKIEQFKIEIKAKGIDETQKNVENLVEELQQRFKNISPSLDFEHINRELEKYKKQFKNAQSELIYIMENPPEIVGSKELKYLEKIVRRYNEANNAIKELQDRQVKEWEAPKVADVYIPEISKDLTDGLRGYFREWEMSPIPEVLLSAGKYIDATRGKIEELQKAFSESGKDFYFEGNSEQLEKEIQKVTSELNGLFERQDKAIELGKVDTNSFKELIRDIENARNRLEILGNARPEALNRTLQENAEKARVAAEQLKVFEGNLSKLQVPPVDETNLKKLQSALKKTETDLEKLRIKLANGITMGRISANVDDKGFRVLREQMALAEKRGEALREKIKQIQKTTSQTSNGAKNLGDSVGYASKSFIGLANSGIKAIKPLNNLGNSFRSLLRIILPLLGIRQLFNWGKQAIEIASDITEVQNVVDVAFGKMAYKVEEFAETSIEQFGMSELTLKQVSSRFQAMGTAMGFPIGQMSDMSVELTKLTADMASFYNVEQEDVAKSLESIFTGTTRPLRQYGLDLTQATLQEWALKQGLDANIQSMSQAEKTMLRYQYVMANTGAAQGDFARTADTWANQVRILKQNFEQLASVIGGVLVNAFKPLIQALNTAMKYVIAFVQTVSNTLGKIFGWTYEGGSGGFVNDMEDAAGSAEDVAGGMSDAEKSAKKIKTHLLAIDELNVVEPDSGGSGGAGGGSGSDVLEWDTSEIEGGWKKIEDFSGNLLKFFDPLLTAWNLKGNFVMDAWKYALNEIWKLAKDIGRDFLRVWNQQETIDMFEDILQIIGDIGITIGNLARNLRIAWNYNDTGFRILENIRDIFAVIIQNIREAADATVIWSDQLDFRPLMQAIERFTKSLIPVADSLSGILSDFYITVLLPLGKWTIEKGLPDLLDVMTDLSNSINWDKIRNSFKELDKELLKISKFTFTALYDFIKNFLSPVAKFTMNEALPLLLDTITDLSQKINWDLLNGALSTMWEVLSKFAVGIGNGIITFFEAIEPLLTSAVAEFINQIALAIEFLGNVFNMIPDSIIEGFGSALASVLTAFVVYQGTGEIVRSIGMGIETMCMAVSNGFALLTAHPYMAIAAGIAAVAGALVSMNKSAEEQEQISLFGDKLSNITDNINNAADAIRNRTQASQEYVQSAGLAEAQMAKELADRYFELSEKESLTNDEKLEMQILASKLVDTLPGLETYYNTETGLLDTTRESIEKLIDSRLREIQLKAVEEELTKAYQDRITAMNDLKAAAEPVEAAQSRMAELEQKYKDASDKSTLLQQYEDLSTKLQNCDGDTEELLEKQQELWNQITNEGAEEFPTFDSLHQKMAEASQEMYDFKDEYDQVMKNFGVSQEAYQGVEKNVSELTNMFTTGMVDAARDGIDGFSGKMRDDTGTGDAMVENAKKAFAEWKGADGWDSHSPSKKTYQTAVDVIDGFNNGITENTQSSIDVIIAWATEVSNAMKSALGIGDMAETTDPSASMFGGIISNFTSTWSMFSETWTEYLESWKTSNEELYWGEEIWNTNWMNIYNTYLKVWAQFEKQWKTNFDKWWKLQIVPYFSVKQWTEFGSNMKNGLYGGFRSIVNDVGGILNSMISMFDSAFKKLEKSMNKLIKDYNKAAAKMGTSTIDPVEYIGMGKVQIPAYAAGGFPEDGLFYANHTELVGQFSNGRTAVVNNEQIIEGIKRGVKEAVAEALSTYLSDIASSNREIAEKEMSVNIGDDEIFEANRRAAERRGWQF